MDTKKVIQNTNNYIHFVFFGLLAFDFKSNRMFSNEFRLKPLIELHNHHQE